MFLFGNENLQELKKMVQPRDITNKHYRTEKNQNYHTIMKSFENVSKSPKQMNILRHNKTINNASHLNVTKSFTG